jgi:hypothetical protein
MSFDMSDRDRIQNTAIDQLPVFDPERLEYGGDRNGSSDSVIEITSCKYDFSSIDDIRCNSTIWDSKVFDVSVWYDLFHLPDDAVSFDKTGSTDREVSQPEDFTDIECTKPVFEPG